MLGAVRVSMQYMSLGFLSLLFSFAGYGQEKVAIRVLDDDGTVNLGQPVVIEIKVTLTEAVKPRSISPFHGLVLEVSRLDNPAYKSRVGIPPDFIVLNRDGLEYGQRVVIFYDHFAKRLVFQQPGEYKLNLALSHEVEGQAKMTVREGLNSDRKALSILSEPNDYFLLEFGSNEYGYVKIGPESVARLRRVVSECKGSLLARWAAGRLGLEAVEAVQKTIVKDPKATIQQPFVKQARSYLSTAMGLPDEFPIREQIIFSLANLELSTGNRSAAINLLDELGRKYPNGRYGKKATAMKEQLKVLEDR